MRAQIQCTGTKDSCILDDPDSLNLHIATMYMTLGSNLHRLGYRLRLSSPYLVNHWLAVAVAVAAAVARARAVIGMAVVAATKAAGARAAAVVTVAVAAAVDSKTQ